jgi:hypothetical protein
MGALKKIEPVEDPGGDVTHIEEQNSINYALMEKSRTAKLQKEIEDKLRAEAEIKGHSLQKLVLVAVVAREYEKAKDDIDKFIKFKSSFPDYPKRVKGHAHHCKELIEAINVKRNFPDLSSLNMSKQKEILDHVLVHFEELKNILKIMEKIAGEEALNDLKSTVWVLRIFSYVIMIGVLGVFFKSFSDEVGQPLWTHFNFMTDDLFHKIWRFFSS